MKKIQCFWLSAASLSGGVLTPAVFAEQNLPIDDAPWQRVNISEVSSSDQPILSIPQLRDLKFPETRAELLIQSPILTTFPDPKKHQIETRPVEINPDIEPIQITVTADRISRPRSTPVYTITAPEIQEQGSNSIAEVLQGLPGFAINDVGHGADIHTGTYYRGASINQSVFLLNGRPIGSNISTYHGATDLNSLPVNAIERVELSSGTSSTLYGSEAFGGVVNIISDISHTNLKQI